MTQNVARYRNCFQPQQWFYDEGVLVWVYRTDNENRWMVGYFFPDKTWFTDSVFAANEDGKTKAAQRVHWLNGGNTDKEKS